MKISMSNGSLEFAAGRFEPRVDRARFGGSTLGMTAKAGSSTACNPSRAFE